MTIRFVYIASPYTKGDVAINVRRSIECADALAEAGFVPFCPLLTHLWHLMSPHEYKFWTALDDAWIERCDALVRLPGESSGADNEVALAGKLGKPVYMSTGWLLDLNDFERWAGRQ